MSLTSLKFQCKILSMHCLGVQTVCLLRMNSEIEATTVWSTNGLLAEIAY